MGKDQILGGQALPAPYGISTDAIIIRVLLRTLDTTHDIQKSRGR